MLLCQLLGDVRAAESLDDRWDLLPRADSLDRLEVVGPAAPPSEARLTHIRVDGAEIVLSAWVPAGKQRVTLESRPRIGAGSWLPEGRLEVGGEAGTVEFRLPNRRASELLRVRAEGAGDLPLPAAFYSGTARFDARIVTNPAPSWDAVPGSKGEGTGASVFDAGTSSKVNPGALVPGSSTTVAESDIWRIDGDTLYFFNQGRGLQVLDLREPDAPRLRGELPVSEWGEQMYLLPARGPAGERFVALLLAGGCGDGGTVRVVRVAADGHVTFVKDLPFRGQLRESRLVGDRLYLASLWWHAVAAPGKPSEAVTWRGDTVVTAHLLADPAGVVPEPQVLELAASPLAIQATDEFLFVATSVSATYDASLQAVVPGTNLVEVVDIRDAGGRMARRGTVTTRGQVADKFKLSQEGDVLRVVSFRDGLTWAVATTNWFSRASGKLEAVSGGVLHRAPPSDPAAYRAEPGGVEWERTPAQAWLETFALAAPGGPGPLGALLLKEGESLYATRFDGDRAYVVTFRRVDPLFLVDLSDPARPSIRGQLEVPGFSTYLTPLGDGRLLAMGLEGGQPIVSLFDVADLARPRLLSKVRLQAEGGWGYSEANNDEKAFHYSPEAGLVLFPWQGWADGRSFDTIQLVDLRGDALVRRGVVRHAMSARRAAVHGERVISVSASELLSVAIDDRDQPRVVAEVPLQYRVDRTWVLGDRLVQWANLPVSNGLATLPRVSIAPAAAPESPTGSIHLPTGLSILGLDLRGSRLHVLQQAPATNRLEEQVVTNTVFTWVPRQEARLVTNLNLTPLPTEYRVTFTTNLEVKVVPQPPLRPILSVEEQVVVVPYPPFPTLVPYQTNVVCDPGLATPCVTNVYTSIVWVELPPLVRTNRVYAYGPEVPQPDLLVTNEVVVRQEEALPTRWRTNSVTVVTEWVAVAPVLTTNQVVSTNVVSVPVPGHLVASVVECGGDVPRLLGQARSESGFFPSAGTLTAVWAAEDLLVWTDAGGSFGGYGPWVLDAGIGAPVPGLTARFAWGGWGLWMGSASLHFLPVRVSDPLRPVVDPVVLREDPTPWSGTSRAFAAAGRVYFSHETRTLVATNPPATGAASPAGLDRWESRHTLDVLDLTDPEEARWLRPSPLPGALEGLRADGALLFVRGGIDVGGAWEERLQALSHDGLEVRAVDALPIAGCSLLVQSDGVVLLGRAATKDAPAAVESWSLGEDARWHRYAEVPLGGAVVSGLRGFPEGGVVAEVDGGFLHVLASAGAERLAFRWGVARPCGLYPDWSACDLSPTTGLWIPRGPHGLWNIRPEPLVKP